MLVYFSRYSGPYLPLRTIDPDQFAWLTKHETGFWQEGYPPDRRRQPPTTRPR